MTSDYPKILAIETATEACSVALLVGGEAIERYQIAPRDHGRLLLRMVDDLMSEAGLVVSQLDVVAFGRGPGAFTGVRIATGVTQGIAFAADLPVAPISTLAALARGAWVEKGAHKVLAAIDARIQEVYWGSFHFDHQGNPAVVDDECVCVPTSVPLVTGDGWIGWGSGWNPYQDILSNKFMGNITGIVSDVYPHASDIAYLAVAAVETGRLVSAEHALPVYLRDQVAEKSASKAM